MSFKAKFTVDGKDYRVFHCSYSLQQDVDKTGRPSSEVRGGTLQLEVEATGDSALAAWMMDAYTKMVLLPFTNETVNKK